MSEQLYVRHHTYFIYDSLCTMHKVTSTLWVHTIVVTTLHPLHSWHHTLYIQHHTHNNTKVISAISPCISDTTSTVSVSSNPVYQLYYTHSLYDTTHYMYDITFSMHDISWTLYGITPYVRMKSHPLHVWHHRQFIWHHIHSCWQHTIVCMSFHKLYDIICIIHDVTHTVCMITQALYLTWNPLNCHLTHSVCHHNLSA